MSPFDKWVQWLCVADKWVLVNGQPVLVSTGPWRAWTGLDFGLGRPRHVSCGEDVHVARSGLLSGSGVWGWCTVGSQALVHRPQGRSAVDRVHAGTGRAVHHVPGARGDGRLRFPPCFYSGVSPAAGRAGWRQIRYPPDTVVQLAWLSHVCECACVSAGGVR